jgi:molybdenum cofactor synthesis domain-containing protein
MTWHRATYISSGMAFNRLRQSIKIQPQIEHISVFESYGRVLAKEVRSPINVPMYDSSLMDGFAVLADDIKHASNLTPVTLNVVRSAALGKFSNHNLRSGQAYRISTGGFLPYGSNAIVPVEYISESKDEVEILASFRKGSFISPSGGNIVRNAMVFNQGKILKCQDVALLSLLGINKVEVYQKPIVAIIPTGDELTDKMKEVNRGKILNTNSHFISRLVLEGGGLPIDLGISPDNVNWIKKKVSSALDKADVILTIAGSSVGKYDFVEQSINSLGKPGVLAHGVKLDRGRVTGIGTLRGKPIIMLPGPIQGAVNAFIMFARPLLDYLLGLPEFNGLVLMGKLMEKWEARKKFRNFTKVVYVSAWVTKGGSIKAIPITGDTADITVLTRANGYLLLPESKTVVAAGEKVNIHILPGLSYTSGYSGNFLSGVAFMKKRITPLTELLHQRNN